MTLLDYLTGIDYRASYPSARGPTVDMPLAEVDRDRIVAALRLAEQMASFQDLEGGPDEAMAAVSEFRSYMAAYRAARDK